MFSPNATEAKYNSCSSVTSVDDLAVWEYAFYENSGYLDTDFSRYIIVIDFTFQVVWNQC